MWTESNGKQKNNAVAADASAIHRGGSLNLDLTTLQTELLPWDDGDSITLDFILPGAVENVATTPVGWEGTVAGTNWGVGVADLDGVKGIGKLSDAMDSFNAPGSQSYVRLPISEVPASGEYKPVQKQLGGDWQDFVYLIQLSEAEFQAQAPGETVKRTSFPGGGDIAVYHKTKRHDITGVANYMTGKAAHIPPPVAVGFRANQTTVTGWCYGTWEIDEVTGILTKVFDAAVIQGWSAQTSTVVVDAILGYTSIGVTIGSNGASPRTMSFRGPNTTENIYTSPAGGMRVSQYSWYRSLSGDTLLSNENKFSCHEDVGGTGTDFDYITDSLADVGAISGETGDKWVDQAPDTGTFDIAAGKKFTTTRVYGTPDGHQWRFTYDSGTATNSDFSGWQTDGARNSVSDLTAPPTVTITGNGFVLSKYLTYESLTGVPPVTTNAVVDPTSVPKGVSSELSADITSPSETITAAEWWIDSDPGEGNGTPCDLSAGTTSREATATIPTGSLGISTYSVRVRGYSVAAGWGAYDQAQLIVTEAIPVDPGGLDGELDGELDTGTFA